VGEMQKKEEAQKNLGARNKNKNTIGKGKGKGKPNKKNTKKVIST
jgi:hypothetical protein